MGGRPKFLAIIRARRVNAVSRPSLSREGEKDQDVDPDRCHGMPVPRRDVDDDSSSFDVKAVEPGRDVGEEQGHESAGEMEPVHRRENVDE